MMNEFYDPFRCGHELVDMDNLTPEQQEEVRVKTVIIGCFTYVFAMIIAILICMALGSCTTTEYVVMPEYHTDTLIQTKVVHDSIHVKDSTHVSEKHNGDTVLIEREKWHTKFVYRDVHDTLYVSKTDTIPQPYPVETIKEVPAELTWWQQTRIHIGGIVIFLALIWLSIKYLFPLIRRRFGW